MPRPACSCPPANAADAGPSDRPGPTAPLADKERWIAGKYVDKWRLARPGGAGGGQQLADWLWDAVARGDIKAGERRAKVDRDATAGWGRAGRGKTGPHRKTAATASQLARWQRSLCLQERGACWGSEGA